MMEEDPGEDVPTGEVKMVTKSWRDVVFEKLVVAVLAGTTLAVVNHFFWERQEQAKKQDFYFQEKVRVYADVSKLLTELIGDLNARIEHTKGVDAAVLNALDAKVDTDLARLGAQLSFVRVYFSNEANTKAHECRSLIARLARDAEEFVQPESEVGRCAQKLADLLATETRAEFATFVR